MAIGHLEKGFHGVGPHVGVDGDRIGERGALAGADTDPGLCVRRRRRCDVAALGVGDDQQAMLARRCADSIERCEPVATVELEQRHLRLDRTAIGRDGLDQSLAVALDGPGVARATIGQAAEHAVGKRAARIDADAQGAAGLGHLGGETISEGRGHQAVTLLRRAAVAQNAERPPHPRKDGAAAIPQSRGRSATRRISLP